MTTGAPQRIGFLDTWRACAVLAMIAWHFVWDLSSAGILPETTVQSMPAELCRYAIAVSFISVSGVCARLSRHVLRRGIIVSLAAVIVTAASYIFGSPIRWGILHLLGASMLLYGAAKKHWEKIPCTHAVGAAITVFVLTFYLPLSVRVNIPFLFPLGLRTADFFSADYYPLLPWTALFFAAASAGERLSDMPEETKYRQAPRALAWLSRRSLGIYLLHQPVLLCLTELLRRAIG